MGPPVIVIGRHELMSAWACMIHSKLYTFRHSSRRRPLKLWIDAFSTGFPGRTKSRRPTSIGPFVQRLRRKLGAMIHRNGLGELPTSRQRLERVDDALARGCDVGLH